MFSRHHYCPSHSYLVSQKLTAVPISAALFIMPSILCAYWLVYSNHLKILSTYPYPESTVEKLLMWSYRFDEPLRNVSTSLPQALFTVLANDVSKLCMINASGGCSLPMIYLLCSGRTNLGAGFIPGWSTNVLTWGFKSFCGLGGLWLKTLYSWDTSNHVFSIIDKPPVLTFVIPNQLRDILSLGAISLSRTYLSFSGVGVVKLGNAKWFSAFSGIKHMTWWSVWIFPPW